MSHTRTALAGALAGLALAGAVQADGNDRITASPTLPKAASEKQGEPAASRAALAGLVVGQVLYSAEGLASARIAEIVRDKDGKPVSVILTMADGARRYTPAADLRSVRGRAETRLSRAQILALPRVEAN